MSYDPKQIEKKWQEYWKKEKVFETKTDSEKPKFYCLDMFPYPSGQGLHVGHPRGYVATDAFSHFKRMNGYNVLHPMGWDAFGLPAENYAIKMGIHPKYSIKENVEHFKQQLDSIGLSYDWNREINTTDPEYFKWTQWIFIQMFNKGLAYEDTLPINWCPSCKTGLANEEVVNGLCDRCGAQVERKSIRQWVLKITKYADRLLEDLDDLDWPEQIKEMQRNWIGRSEGAVIRFPVFDKFFVEVFTTRPDTIFGATFLVLAPEHNLVKKVLDGNINIENIYEVKNYTEKAKKKSDIERTELAKEKTGVPLKGLTAKNPISGEEIPIWVADYVLGFYGKGGIMSVPAHDERDYEMAKKYGLEIREVIKGGELPYTGEGEMVNSGDFSGISSEKGKEEIIKKLEEDDNGESAVNYKLRDWVFSRQRYWGEPIPLVHCKKCGIVPINEEDLPLMPPEVERYEPTGTGESPLSGIDSFVNTKCPKCSGEAKRETNTMPQWAGSCWYYLAFIAKGISQKLDFPPNTYKEEFERWMPVDLYVGGAEHAVLHLLYARFWHKFLYDIGVVSDKEPFYKLKNQGMILGEGGIKMSKSKGNVVSPDDVIKKYGADCLRLYELFLGGFEDRVAWSDRGVSGMYRFLDKVENNFNLLTEREPSEDLERELHKTIKKVTEDTENFKFNTAISCLMVFNNRMKEEGDIPKKIFTEFVKMLAPFAPHFSENLWEGLGNNPSIFNQSWPKYSKEKAKDNQVVMIIQVNGKVRHRATVDVDISEKEAEKIAIENTKKWTDKGNIKKVVVIGNKLVNIVCVE